MRKQEASETGDHDRPYQHHEGRPVGASQQQPRTFGTVGGVRGKEVGAEALHEQHGRCNEDPSRLQLADSGGARDD